MFRKELEDNEEGDEVLDMDDPLTLTGVPGEPCRVPAPSFCLTVVVCGSSAAG